MFTLEEEYGEQKYNEGFEKGIKESSFETDKKRNGFIWRILCNQYWNGNSWWTKGIHEK